MEADLLLACRDRGLALGIGLNHRGGQGEFARNKGQHIRDQFYSGSQLSLLQQRSIFS